MTDHNLTLDILCAGHACYDLVFQIDHHPVADEKIFAQNFLSTGGGPAANAAIAISRLGLTAGFAGYLGQDIYGQLHYQEFIDAEIDTHLLIRGKSPTPLSAILVKPNGQRALVNYKGQTTPLSANALDFSSLSCKAVLFDGHEPEISVKLADFCRQYKIPSVLDAGSVHKGTLALMEKVDYLVCSEKFARHFADSPEKALNHLAHKSPVTVITLGEKGLIWQKEGNKGHLPAFSVNAVDTTGAGDAFHAAFTVALVRQMDWQSTLYYASAAGALCCTQPGARPGLVTQSELNSFLKKENRL